MDKVLRDFLIALKQQIAYQLGAIILTESKDALRDRLREFINELRVEEIEYPAVIESENQASDLATAVRALISDQNTPDPIYRAVMDACDELRTKLDTDDFYAISGIEAEAVLLRYAAN